MIDISDYIFEQMILEYNEKIFPKPNGNGKFKIFVGDHGRKRMGERKVSEQEIITAVYGAYKEIGKKFADGRIKISKDGEDSSVVIVDDRKSGKDPVCVVIFLMFNKGNKKKLDYPSFIVKTVFRGANFSGAMRGYNTKLGQYEEKIFLYNSHV